MTLLARTRPSRPTSGPVGRLVSRVATAERLAVARAGVGGVMLARPRLMPGLLGIDSATSGRLSWVVQMLGAREIAMGLGTLAALHSGDLRAQRGWLAAGALADAADAVVVGAALARGRLSAGTGVVVVAVAAAAAVLEVHRLADLRTLDA